MPSFSISVLAAAAFIFIASISLSQPSRGFDLTSDGTKAVFKFFDPNWDVLFESISFRSFFGDFSDYKNHTDHVIAALKVRTATLEVWHS
jgi:hypothetical protein